MKEFLSISLLIFASLADARVASEHFDKQHPKTLKDIIREAEIRHNLPKGLLYAIAEVESNHKVKSFTKEDGKSRLASYGLFQIQLAAARQMGFKGTPNKLMFPEVNVEYAARYLKWLLTMDHIDYSKALTCYNSGPYSVACKKGYSKYVGLVFNAWVSNGTCK